MQQDIINTLHETTNELLQTINSFEQESFNKIPFEGSWTAGQVSEHILKAETGVPVVWLGNTQPTVQHSDEKISLIKTVFLDFTHKMKSPDYIVPTDSIKDKTGLYEAIKNNREEIERLAASIDLDVTYTDFSFPALGSLTGVEWATFIICHSKRHIHQLKNIQQSIG